MNCNSGLKYTRPMLLVLPGTSSAVSGDGSAAAGTGPTGCNVGPGHGINVACTDGVGAGKSDKAAGCGDGQGAEAASAGACSAGTGASETDGGAGCGVGTSVRDELCFVGTSATV